MLFLNGWLGGVVTFLIWGVFLAAFGLFSGITPPA